jgi:uncharacterized protein (TIGR02285 family)
MSQRQEQGVVSSAYNLLFQRISYPERLEYLPLNRIFKELENDQKPVCTLFKMKTQEREKKFQFSLPIHFLSSIRLYQNAKREPLKKAYLNEESEVKSLSDLLNDSTQGTLLVEKDFSYGDLLDKQIQANLGNKKTVSFVAVGHSKVSVLFFAERTSLALMYPGEVAEYLAGNPESEGTYRAYKIQGLESELDGHVMCNNHPDSTEYIERVNKAMKAIYQTDAYYQAHLRYNEKSQINNIRAKIKQLQEL